jgi:hypothetical protein
MLTLLFWNMGGRDRAGACARLAHRYGATILFVAECPRPLSILRALNPPGATASYFSHPKTDCRVSTFSTVDRTALTVVEDSRHYAIRRLVSQTGPELLIATAHFPSKLWSQDDEQERVFRRLGVRIAEVEAHRAHARTLIIGDLNAHPYQRGVVSADGLHGVPTRAIASRDFRTISRQTYRMFYNPMWQFFGDGSPGPPGTYYRWRAEHDCVFWYLFDQVLLRPGLLPYFSNPDLEIVTGDGVNSFITPEG